MTISRGAKKITFDPRNEILIHDVTGQLSQCLHINTFFSRLILFRNDHKYTEL